jgi:type VI secretion system secreted protein Hcp
VSKISKASPALFVSSAAGTHIKQARLSGVRGAGKHKGVDFYKVDLSDVLVSSYQQGDSADAVPTEQFSLNFAKIEVSYAPQGSGGKLESPVKAGWDLKANKKV